MDEITGGALPSRIALEVKNLSVSFGHGAAVPVGGVSFEVRQGETLGIVGESGSGKSLTGLAIMRLLGAAAQIDGSVHLIDEQDNRVSLLDLPERDMRSVRGSKIAMIFQEPLTSLNPIHKIETQISEAIRLHQDLPRAALRAQVIELLAKVGIPDPALRMRAYPHQLSGGMRQRVMIAMALACNPRLVIADEPTTALDVTVQAQVIELLSRLQADLGTAMIFVTHDLPLIRNVADHVAVMYAGQIVEQGRSSKLFAEPRHPYTQALLRSSPTLGQRRSTDKLEAIKGSIPSPANQPKGCRFHPRCPYARAGHCDTVAPELEITEDLRSVRCHYWRDLNVMNAA